MDVAHDATSGRRLRQGFINTPMLSPRVMNAALQISSPRLSSVHAVRAVAALLVALLHAYCREQLEADAILPHVFEFARIGTDLFFVISGAVLAYGLAGKQHGQDQAASFLYDRFTRVYPVYWIATALTLFVWFASGKHLLGHMIQAPEPLSTILLIPNGHLPALMVAWTLSHLLFFYLILALTVLAPPKAMPYIFAVWAGVTLMLQLAGAGTSQIPALHFFGHISSLEFMAGVIIMRHALSGGRLAPLTFAALAIIWLYAAMRWIGPNPIDYEYNGLERLALIGGPAILIAAAAIHFDFAKPRRPSKVFRFLGDVSFGIYLMHNVALALVGRIWMSFDMKGPIDNIIAFAAMMGLSILAGWALHVFIEKPVRDAMKAAKPGFMRALRGEARASAA